MHKLKYIIEFLFAIILLALGLVLSAMNPLGMPVLIVGVVLLVIAIKTKNKGPKSKRKKTKTMEGGDALLGKRSPLGMAVVGAVSVIVGVVSFVPVLSVFLVIGGIITIIMSFSAKKARKRHKAEIDIGEYYDREIEKAERLAKFYEECRKQGLSSDDTPAAKEKLAIFARQNHFNAATFRASKDAYMRLGGLRDDRRKFEEDVELDFANHEFEGKSGRDKRLAMLNKMAAHYAMQANAIHEQMKRGMDATQERKLDWATHGGIASGIAGPAAGLAVAMDIQAKNAAIDERNAAAVKAISPWIDQMLKQAYDLNQQADRYRAVKEKNQLALTEQMTAERIKESADIRLTDISVNAVGVVHVKVSLQPKPFRLSSGGDAVLDGWITVALKSGGKNVGECLIALPLAGADRAMELQGVCFRPGIKAEHYDGEIRYGRLFAIEKMVE